jgi:hypothetical protein
MVKDAYSRFMAFKKAMGGQGVKVGRVKPKAADKLPPAPAPKPKPVIQVADATQPIVRPQAPMRIGPEKVKVGKQVEEASPSVNPLLGVLSFNWEPDLDVYTA